MAIGRSGVMKRTTAALLCVMGGVSAAWGARGPVHVEVARVTTCQSALEKNIPGRVVAVANVEVVSPVEGRVVEVASRVGATVKEGDLLYRIDESGYRTKVEGAENLVAKCAGDLRLAQTTCARVMNSKGISEEQKDKATNAVLAAEANKKDADMALRRAKADLAACRIVAPISGVVDSLSKTVGDHMKGGADAARVVKRSPALVRFALSSGEFLRMFNGMDGVACSNAVVRLTLSDGSPFPEEGVVESVRSMIDERTDSLSFTARFPNANGILRAGGFVSVTLTDRRQIMRYAVPASAVAWDAEGPYVWVVDESGVVSRRGITCGRLEGASRHVMAGLGEGEAVVAGGVHRLEAGMKVEYVAERTGK